MELAKNIGTKILVVVGAIALVVVLCVLGDMTIGRLGLGRGEVEFHESLRPGGDAKTLVVAFHGMGGSWQQSMIFEQVWHDAGADVVRIGTPGEIYDQEAISTKTADETVRRLTANKSYTTIVYDGTSMGGQAARLTAIKSHDRIAALSREVRETMVLDNSPYGNQTLVTKDRDNIPNLRFYPFGRLANALRLHDYLDKDTNIEIASLWESQMLAFALPKPETNELQFIDKFVYIKALNDTETVRVDDAVAAWRVSAPQLETIDLATKHVSFHEPDELPLHIDGRKQAIAMVLE